MGVGTALFRSSRRSGLLGGGLRRTRSARQRHVVVARAVRNGPDRFARVTRPAEPKQIAETSVQERPVTRLAGTSVRRS